MKEVENGHSGYIVNDRRHLFNSEDGILLDSAPKTCDPDRILLFSYNEHSFFGRIWINRAVITKVNEHYWSETQIHADQSVTGGGGPIHTYSNGKVSETIDPSMFLTPL